MFSHIPEEIFCPQVSGNVNDALRVLKVTLEGPERNAHFFDLELSLVDPENPVTQISKTPSDEEFPWCGEDTDADVPSTTEEQEQELMLKSESNTDIVLDSYEKETMREKDDSGEKYNEMKNEGNDKRIEEKEKNNSDNKDEMVSTHITDNQDAESHERKNPSEHIAEKSEKGDLSEEKYKKDEQITGKEELSKPSEKDIAVEELETSKTMDELEVPTADHINNSAFDALSIASPAEDPVKEKREREEKIVTDYKNLAFPKRPRSMIKSELLVKDIKKFIEDMKRKIAPEDLDVRIVPSNMACRFGLPIDLTRLKGECPLSYLRKYCKVTDSRRAIYKEKFEDYKTDETITVINLKNIYESLYHESKLQEEVMHLHRLLNLDLTMELDVETFTVISCLMERIVLKSQGRGAAQGYKKNVFEITNFTALNGKLQDIEIACDLMNLLQYIRGS